MYSCHRWMTNEHMGNLCDTETFVIVAYATERTPGILLQLLVWNNNESSAYSSISMTDSSSEEQECLYFHTRLCCNCCIFPPWITDLNICFFQRLFLQLDCIFRFLCRTQWARPQSASRQQQSGRCSQQIWRTGIEMSVSIFSYEPTHWPLVENFFFLLFFVGCTLKMAYTIFWRIFEDYWSTFYNKIQEKILRNVCKYHDYKKIASDTWN